MKHGGKGLAFKSRIGCGRVGKAVSGEGFFFEIEAFDGVGK